MRWLPTCVLLLPACGSSDQADRIALLESQLAELTSSTLTTSEVASESAESLDPPDETSDVPPESLKDAGCDWTSEKHYECPVGADLRFDGVVEELNSVFEDAYNLSKEVFRTGIPVEVSLVEADFRDLDLSGLTALSFFSPNALERYPERYWLVFYNFSGANFSGANLSETVLGTADLSEGDLSGSTIHGADWYQVDLKGAQVAGASIANTRIGDSSLSEIDFTETALSENSFNGSSFADSNFAGADISDHSFKKTSMNGADFSDAQLDSAEFTEADLSFSNFSGAVLTNASLSGAVAYNANFSSARLTNALLEEVDFEQANLSSANLRGARVWGAIFIDADMAGVLNFPPDEWCIGFFRCGDYKEGDDSYDAPAEEPAAEPGGE